MKSPAAVLVVIAVAGPSVLAQAPRSVPVQRQHVTLTNGNLTLDGFLFKPDGPGPFPAVVWNHGSEQYPDRGPQFESVARIFVPAGYVVFAPVRRGHGSSQGQYITDQIARARATQPGPAVQQLMVHLMESEQLSDQLEGLKYVKALDYVDTSRLAVAGCSYGGIETLLAAERGAGFKAAIAISPAALSWNGSPVLQRRLVQAVRSIDIPVMILQPAKDASLEPTRVLGAEFNRLHKPFTGKIYPAEGPEEEQAHCFGGARGMHVWAEDALAFLARVLH